jgi:hypothetical protein
MRNQTLAVALAVGALTLAVAACKTTAAASPAPAAATQAAAHSAASPSSATAALPPPPTAVTLGALTLADFPSTAAGNEARGICEAWLRLRQQYEDRMVTDSPYQLNQWFSSAAWQKAQSDGAALGNAPAYSRLETALGEALAGDVAGAETVKLMDSACAKGD